MNSKRNSLVRNSNPLRKQRSPKQKKFIKTAKINKKVKSKARVLFTICSIHFKQRTKTEETARPRKNPLTIYTFRRLIIWLTFLLQKYSIWGIRSHNKNCICNQNKGNVKMTIIIKYREIS